MFCTSVSPFSARSPLSVSVCPSPFSVTAFVAAGSETAPSSVISAPSVIVPPDAASVENALVNSLCEWTVTAATASAACGMSIQERQSDNTRMRVRRFCARFFILIFSFSFFRGCLIFFSFLLTVILRSRSWQGCGVCQCRSRVPPPHGRQAAGARWQAGSPQTAGRSPGCRAHVPPRLRHARRRGA